MRMKQQDVSAIILVPPPGSRTMVPKNKSVDTYFQELIKLYMGTMFMGVAMGGKRCTERAIQHYASWAKGHNWIDPETGVFNIQVYAQWLGYICAKHRSTYPANLNSFFRGFVNWAWRNGHIAHVDLSRSVRMPKIPRAKQREPFSFDEYKRLVDAAFRLNAHCMLWAIIVGFETGMSRSDVCMLKAAQVNMEELSITYARQKTGEVIVVPIMPGGDLYYALKQRMEVAPMSDTWPNEPEKGVFFLDTTLAGSAINCFLTNDKWFSEAFREVREEAGITKMKGFHCFRATMSSMCANGGMNTVVASRITGHRSPEVFKRYVTTDLNHMRDQMVQAYKIYHGVTPGAIIAPRMTLPQLQEGM